MVNTLTLFHVYLIWRSSFLIHSPCALAILVAASSRKILAQGYSNIVNQSHSISSRTYYSCSIQAWYKCYVLKAIRS